MSTYVNDLRLEEIGTGERSGTWGTATNTSLELIGEALGFGTEAITTNADTHTTTVADGATDPGRAIFLKYTGTLDSACTITIAPNTISRLHFIENGTSGSQNIIISQGSGASITIPPGDVKVVYLDGAGSGAAVVDAFASLSVVDLKVQDDLTVTDDATIGGTLGVTGILTCTDDIIIGDGKTIGSASDVDAMTIASNGQITLTQTLIGTALDISGDIDIDGTSNLDIVDIDGAVDMASTLTVAGVVDITDTTDASDATGDTGALRTEGGASIAKKLFVGTDLDVDGTANLDVVDIDGAVDMASTLQVDGVATFTGRDVHSGGITIANAGQIGSVGDTDAIAIASDGVVTLTQKLVGTELDISGDIDVDGTTNLDVVDIDGAVDMASTLQVDGAITSSAGMTLTVADNSDVLTIVSTDADASSGPNITLYRNSGSPADSDNLGDIHFKGRNDNSQDVEYAVIDGRIVDASDGTEDGKLEIATIVAGSGTSRINMINTETVFNEDSIDLDFRVESNGNANMLFVDGANDKVGIGTSSPGDYLDEGDNFVIFDSGHTGITLASGTGSEGGIFFADGTSGSDRFRGMLRYNHSSNYMEFRTDAGERLRIDSSGNVMIGRTDPLSGAEEQGCVFYPEGFGLLARDGTSTATMMSFVRNAAVNSVVVGSITSTGSATAFNTSSDYRLKENVTYSWDATTRLKQLKPARFNFISDSTDTLVDGFLAHEVSSVVPEAITGNKDGMKDEEYIITPAVKEVRDEDNNIVTEAQEAVIGTRNVPDYQAIDQSKLVPLLVKTIQELEARITALES